MFWSHALYLPPEAILSVWSIYEIYIPIIKFIQTKTLSQNNPKTYILLDLLNKTTLKTHIQMVKLIKKIFFNTF